MPYANIEFIAACLNTYPGLSWTNEVRVFQVPRYDGLDDDAADRSARLAVMSEAVKKAVAVSRFKAQPSVLKLFMAPEFCWRGAKGAYAEDAIDDLHQALHGTVQSDEYAHWLFVWGTAIGATYGKDRRNNDAAEVTNSVLVSEGGPNGAVFRLTKKGMSSIDFLASRVDANGVFRPVGGEIEDRAWLAGKGQRVFHAPQVARPGVEGGVFFEAKGIRFGVEICLDHGSKRIKKVLAKNPQLRPPQVILIPSCGMTIQTEAIPEVDGILAFNVDGGGYFKGGLGASSEALQREIKSLRAEATDAPSATRPFDQALIEGMRERFPTKVFRYTTDGARSHVEAFVTPSRIKIVDAPGFAATKVILEEVEKDANALRTALIAMPGGYYQAALTERADKKQVAFTVLTNALPHAPSRLALKRSLALIGVVCLLNRRSTFSSELPTSFSRLLAALNGSMGSSKSGLAALFGKYGYRNVAARFTDRRPLDAPQLREDVALLAMRYYQWDVPQTGAFRGGTEWEHMIQELGGAARRGSTRGRLLASQANYLRDRKQAHDDALAALKRPGEDSFQGYGAVIAFDLADVPAR
jgi:hypothetical protein